MLVLGRTSGNSKFSGISKFERNSLAVNQLKDENEAKTEIHNQKENESPVRKRRSSDGLIGSDLFVVL